MADISAEIAAFQSARYGEDVRSSMVSLANKVNDEVEANTTQVNDNTAEVESFSLDIGTVTTLASTDPATATISGSGYNLTLDLGIPQGAAGGVAGDISQNAVNFADTSSRVNVVTGESLATGFAKIKKWFTDLASGAFAAVSNALDVTEEGYVLDARQGKILNDLIATKKDATDQSDWEEEDSTSGNYIANKPDLLAYNAYLNLSLTYNGSTGRVLLWRYGPIVVADFSITCSAASADTNLTISGTVPSGYRPAGTRYFPCNPVTSSEPSGNARFSVNSAGKVQFVSSTTGAREYRFGAVWITPDDLPE